ncbi:MAG: disulfide bond formation protein B [Acidimicrobiia bacterium]
MVDLDTANSFFTALTLIANAAFVALVGLGVASRAGGQRLSRRVVELVAPGARRLALVVAIVATLGSLFYSEVKDLVPCDLCWYQRICMYPLAAILAVGMLRRDRSALWYAAPFVVLGAPLALYHWLVERVPSLSDSTSCSIVAPCAVPYFEELGYITLAFMDLSAFLLIGALLLIGQRHDPETSP